eukprot:CAMPEP_0180418638 /NCGR_PEP_ID=MMETSP1036_2-20121128/1668_1 /TAXON_ID=632150 /ORGANISM="Azadinium spinosum, Strain 3D9" /LENGTH=39 /DNA_ID= /DNA_START= /DNA_END= /DNA_ORIENTATION=
MLRDPGDRYDAGPLAAKAHRYPDLAIWPIDVCGGREADL